MSRSTMIKRVARSLAVAGMGLAAVVGVIALMTGAVYAGSPHFVGDPVFVISGNTVCVTGKEAGLGDEAQIEVTLSFDAACINPGSKKPQAANKESFSATGTFPVQNGKANFSLCATATFQPDCTPPMSVSFSNLQVCDDGNNFCAP
jgi:hypothetical protein